MSSPHSYERFFAELKRRRVFRAAAAYGAAAFVAIQVADVVFPRIPLPEWTVSFVVWLAILGFLPALVLAWLFERADGGLRRTQPAPEEIEAIVAQPAGRRWPAGLAALAGVLLLAAGVWTAWRVAAPARTDVVESRLAVFPFAVTASAGLEWLHEGLPTLLSQNLLAPGETETVDPVQVLRSTRHDDGAGIDVATAADAARRLGAGRFVVGAVQGVGGRVRINAGLYALRDSVHALARGEVEGDTTDLLGLVDRLTAQLLGGSADFGAASHELVRTAARTTTSLVALRAYLQGEEQLRNGNVSDAWESFGAAVEADSTFALAMYRKAFAHLVGFGNWRGEAVEWAARAERHSNRLSEYDRRALAAFSAHVNGDVAEAERAYQDLAAAYPGRLDARVLRTMLLADYEPLRGRPLDEAARLFEDVRKADPGYLCIACVGAQIYAHREDAAAMARLSLLALEGQKDTVARARDEVGMRATLSLATGDTAAWNAARRRLFVDVPIDSTSWRTFVFAALTIGRPALADTLVRVDFASAKDVEEYALLMDFVRGRWNDAYRGIGTRSADDLVGHVLTYAQLPLDAKPPGAGAAVRATRSWNGPVSGTPIISDDLGPHLRAYGIAITSLYAGDMATARQFADTLLALPADPAVRPVLANAARLIRGEAAFRSGDLAAARAQLDGLEWRMPPSVLALGFVFGVPRAHMLRAELAWRDGDIELARRWFEHGLHVYRPEDYALNQFRRGQIHDALGNHDRARLHYARVVEALAPADANLAPWREEARSRLVALQEKR